MCDAHWSVKSVRLVQTMQVSHAFRWDCSYSRLKLAQLGVFLTWKVPRSPVLAWGAAGGGRGHPGRPSQGQTGGRHASERERLRRGVAAGFTVSRACWPVPASGNFRRGHPRRGRGQQRGSSAVWPYSATGAEPMAVQGWSERGAGWLAGWRGRLEWPAQNRTLVTAACERGVRIS
jgi:hypothetical protein